MQTRPFEKISYAMLLLVVKRNKYSRYAKELSAELQRELAIRKMQGTASTTRS